MKKLTIVLVVLLLFISTAGSVQARWRGHPSYRTHGYGHGHYRYPRYHSYSYRGGHKAFWVGFAGAVAGSFLTQILLGLPTRSAAREEPEERCDWYYDSEGRSRWHCQGSEWRTRGYGPPVMSLPPAQLPPSSRTLTYSTSSQVPRTPLSVRRQQVTSIPRRSEYPPARVIADCKRTPEHPACQPRFPKPRSTN